jgi:hypothetical protein
MVMRVKCRHNGGGAPNPEQTEKRPPVLVHPCNRPSIILIALSTRGTLQNRPEMVLTSYWISVFFLTRLEERVVMAVPINHAW